MNQQLKFLRYVMQPEIRITGQFLCGSSLQCAYHRRIPNLETVTVHRRSDSKRAYRPQAFFLKLSLTAMIK
jgi:hypothetical protein